MTSFWKLLLGSCLGTLIALTAIFLIFFGSIAAISSGSDTKKIEKNSIIRIKLSPEFQIPEKTNNVSSNGTFSFKKKTAVGLSDIIKTLSAAKTDDRIKGVVLDCEGFMLPQVTTTAFRRALEDFKTSGKFIFTIGKYYTQKDYYVASVADRIYVHPAGGVDFRGYGGQLTFFKNMLDRLDVKVQVYYAGQFKSATEPFRFDKMTEQNRLQTKEYMSALYQIFLENISKSRNIPVEDLKKYANELMIRSSDDAVKYKLVDEAGYEDNLLTEIRKRIGLKESDKIKTVSLGEYYDAVKSKFESSEKNKVAVVYCEGNIIDGKGESGNIGGDKYAEIIRKIRNDDNIKAIVIRMNSGGGSAIASESVWREIQLAKQAGKKVVCSMGDVAASGGYFIACAADSIYAEPNTITGSIGVFSLIPSFQNTLKNKMGITFDTVKTTKHSTDFSVTKDFSPEESAFMQENTDRIYESFLQKVAQGRKKTRDEVHSIAQGRVWTGIKGKEIGLVDQLGTLDDAIACAARMAGLTKYKTKEYPFTKEPLEQFIDDLMNKDDSEASIKTTILKSELGEYYGFYNRIQELTNMKGPQARMIFDLEIK